MPVAMHSMAFYISVQDYFMFKQDIRWDSATVEVKARNVGENFNVFPFVSISVLWRQVNLPCWRDTEQKFRMCSKVPLFPHIGHLDTFLLPHLLRLSGGLLGW